MVVTSTASELRRQAAEARELAERLAREAAEAALAEAEARRPKMPEVSADVRPIIGFTKYQSGKEYHYAARGWREGRSIRWAVTGSESRRFNWPGLLDFIGEANWPSIVVMTAGEHLVAEGQEPPVAERMGAFGRVVGTESVVDPLVRAEVPGYGSGRFARGGMVGPYEG
ncbi:hypothetical protein PBI_INDLOVU_88 [Mycobacterium phage Indlovu]|nr:hypothetical protein PBI_INDLOVU_88 [Mycobacterium phage Indlovu]